MGTADLGSKMVGTVVDCFDGVRWWSTLVGIVRRWLLRTCCRSERARMVLRGSWWLAPGLMCSILVGIRMKDGAECLLSLRKNAMGTLWVARWKMLGLLTGRIGVLVVVSLILIR